MAPPSYNYPFHGQAQAQPPQFVQPMQTMYTHPAQAQVQAQAQAQAYRHAQAQAQRQAMTYAPNVPGQPVYEGVPQYAPASYGHSS